MTWIPLILILISLTIIVWVIYRKLPQVRVVDVSSIPSERERQIKEQIIMKKLQRLGGSQWRVVARGGVEIVKLLSRHGRRTVQKLYRLEQYYQKLKRSSGEGAHSYSDEIIHKRVEEAWELIEKDEFIPAEKIFIDIISHNPKSVVGYENLGNMYVKNAQYDQARETFQFALRLSPDDASVNVSLAELEIKLENPKSALSYLRRAIDKRSKNPRYLDFYIETALCAGSLKDARRGILLMKEVNPENQKIEEFEKRFQEMKDDYIERTSSPTADASQEE
jgi:tetratricopeptide (TPR) repeat protein